MDSIHAEVCGKVRNCLIVIIIIHVFLHDESRDDLVMSNDTDSSVLLLSIQLLCSIVGVVESEALFLLSFCTSMR